MPIDNYFDTIFASSGTTAAIPDATDPSGYVSYTQGYTSDYELPIGNINRKVIERDKYNGLLKEITTALQQYQQNSVAPFITSAMNGGSPYSYRKGARVMLSGTEYISLINSNTDTPPTANWSTLLPVSLGGTGLATLTANNLIIGNGTSAPTFLAPGTSGYTVTSNGTSFVMSAPVTTFSTGMIIPGFSSVAFSNFLILNGDSIGSASSGATHTGTTYAALYTYLWDAVNDTYAPVAGGRGASAAADFAANKKLTMPNCADMSLYGVGSLLTSGGASGGAATVASSGSVSGTAGTTGSTTLSESQIPSHVHSITCRLDQSGSDNFILREVSSSVAGSQDTNATGGGGSHSHTGGTLSATYTGSSTSVIHPVTGVYYNIAL